VTADSKFTVISFTHHHLQQLSLRNQPWQDNGHHRIKSVEARLDFGLGGQLPLSGWPHNPTTRFWPPSTIMVSPESLPHCTGSLRRCLLEEMATGPLWPVYLWRATNDVSHRRFLSLIKLVGGLSKLHCADDDAVVWLTNYGSTQCTYDNTLTSTGACMIDPPPEGMCSASRNVFKLWEITDNISKTYRDRHSYNRKSRGLSNGTNSSDLVWPSRWHFSCLKHLWLPYLGKYSMKWLQCLHMNREVYVAFQLSYQNWRTSQGDRHAVTYRTR